MTATESPDPLRLATERGALMELHPDLQPYIQEVPIFGTIRTVLNSPFVQAWSLNPDKISELNDYYEHKCKQADKASREGDYHTFVFLHERPHRLDALYTLLFDFGQSRAFWQVTGEVWRDGKTTGHWQKEWRELWGEPDELRLRQYAVSRYERRYLRSLPKTFTIYRGLGNPDAVQGMSWTLSRKIAAWFACRNRSNNQGKCFVATGEVERADVIAYFVGRNEREIGVFPENVRVQSIEPQIEDVPKPWAASEAKMIAGGV